jgi:hypothetical protein
VQIENGVLDVSVVKVVMEVVGSVVVVVDVLLEAVLDVSVVVVKVVVEVISHSLQTGCRSARPEPALAVFQCGLSGL